MEVVGRKKKDRKIKVSQDSGRAVNPSSLYPDSQSVHGSVNRLRAAVKWEVSQEGMAERLNIHNEINPPKTQLTPSSEHSALNGLVIAGCS